MARKPKTPATAEDSAPATAADDVRNPVADEAPAPVPTVDPEPPAEPVPPAPPAMDSYPVVVVTTARGVASRRRAGLVFSREPVCIDLDALTPAQLAALKADPRLVVEEGTVEVVDPETEQ